MTAFKKFALCIVAAVAVFAIFPSLMPKASAQETITPETRNIVVAEMNKMLPNEVDKGIVWTKVGFNDKDKMLEFTYQIDPEEMGVTIAELKRDTAKLPWMNFSDSAKNA